MAIQYMRSIHIENYERTKIDLKAWEYEDILESSGNGNSVLIPENIKNISATLEVTAGEGKIQTTTNTLDDVINDVSVVWVDWPAGNVTLNTQDAAVPVTAIRQVNTSGTTRMILRCQ